MPRETAAALLKSARQRLGAAGIPTASLDARLLLQHAADLAHDQLIADPDVEISEAAAAVYRSLIARRAAHEPVSRILGTREFYGRTFIVTADVLDPRPDTETLIDEAVPLLRAGMTIADLGSGSGAIVVTLLAECLGVRGVAIDISAAALAVTRRNADRLGVGDRLTVRQSNWLEGLDGRFDFIISNPPYIAAADIAGLSPDVRNHDPRLALDGGADGLDAYRIIARGAADHLMPRGSVLVEIGAGQEADVAGIFGLSGFVLASRRADLGGHVRCLRFARG